jgi:hypothetical protein
MLQIKNRTKPIENRCGLTRFSDSFFKISIFYNFYYHTIKDINRQNYALTCAKLSIFLLINKNKN